MHVMKVKGHPAHLQVHSQRHTRKPAASELNKTTHMDACMHICNHGHTHTHTPPPPASLRRHAALRMNPEILTSHCEVSKSHPCTHACARLLQPGACKAARMRPRLRRVTSPFTWLSYSARISLSFLLLFEFDISPRWRWPIGRCRLAKKQRF